jgi:ATP-binding cassette, subfamily C, bacterial CydD
MRRWTHWTGRGGSSRSRPCTYFARYLPRLVLAAVVPAVVLSRLVSLDLPATVTIAITLPLIPVFMALVGLTTEARYRRQYRQRRRLALARA